MPRLPWLAGVVLMTACERGREASPSTAQPPSSTPALASYQPAADSNRAHRDSAAFLLYVDSMTRFERRLDSLAGSPSAAAILLHLGRLYKYAERWMYYGGPGWEYATQRRDREYKYSDPDAVFVYSGSHWKRLVEAFPDDSLADDAGWAIANLGSAGECEGDVPCYLRRDVGPALGFLERFPHSSFDSAAVERANTALTGIMSQIPDLHATDTGHNAFQPVVVESLLVRYDAAAARLSPALRSAVRRVTDSLWIRLGKPDHP